MYAVVAPNARGSPTVHQAVSTGDWALDIGPDLSSEQLSEYMNLWDKVTSTALRPDELDRTT